MLFNSNVLKGAFIFVDLHSSIRAKINKEDYSAYTSDVILM